MLVYKKQQLFEFRKWGGILISIKHDKQNLNKEK